MFLVPLPPSMVAVTNIQPSTVVVSWNPSVGKSSWFGGFTDMMLFNKVLILEILFLLQSFLQLSVVQHFTVV